MDNKILSLKEKFVSELDKIDNLADIESIRVSYLGKKGSVTDLLKGMKELSNDERKAFGQKVNELKGLVNEKITEKTNELKEKEIQKEIEFLESPGYNCEGLVCADGVITPRTRMHRKVLWEKRMNQKSQTALQWAKEGYVVNPNATGRKWKNNPHNSKAIIYYVSEEVHEDQEAAKEFLKSRKVKKEK